MKVLLNQWRELDCLHGGFFCFQQKKKNRLIPSVQKRMGLIALQICNGMEYLHQRNVMFRDLKPHNIGMGQDGKIKIFDFGLAREVPPIPGQKEVTIQGTAGSLRYIAPENILGDGCFFSGDVYSFGVLLWELLSLDLPFEHMSRPSHYEVEVAVEGYRPNIRRVKEVPKSVKVLIADCWDEDRSVRPTFSQVREVLESVKTEQEETSRPRRPGPLSMFRLQGSRTTTKAAPKVVSSVGRSKRRERKSPSETDVTNTNTDGD
jgi:serine/threonine protein kinase